MAACRGVATRSGGALAARCGAAVDPHLVAPLAQLLHPAQPLPLPSRCTIEPLVPHRAAAPSSHYAIAACIVRESTVKDEGWGRYEWIRGIIVLWSYSLGFCGFLIIFI